MNRSRALFVLAFTLVVLFAASATAVPEVRLTVADVEVSPDEPTAEEPVTITPTIESSVGSTQAVEIETVTATVDGTEIGTATDVGSLSAGDDVSVPVTTTFDEPGEYTITFEIEGTSEDGETVTVTREETITVSPVSPVRLTVDDVDIEPETPTVGAPVTVPVSVQSSGGSTQPVDVDRVALLADGESLVDADGLGSLAVGDGTTVPLTTTFDEPGAYDLTVEFEGTNANDEPVRVTQPVTVVVEAGAPTVESVNNSAVAGVASDLSVTVGNPTEATLRNIVVTTGGDGLVGQIDRRVIPSLQPGETTDLGFSLRPDSAGETLLETNVSYTTASGTTDTFAETERLAIEPFEEQVNVRVTTGEESTEEETPDLDADIGGILDQQSEEGESDDSSVRVTVSNTGNAPVSDVVLDPRAGDRSLGERPVTGELAAGEEVSTSVSLERTPPEEIVFEARYDAAGEQSEATTTYDSVATRGAVAITGVDLDRDGDELSITGDVGNQGEGGVTGVVVRVSDSEAVSPAYPSRDFFVGGIDGDGFAPFELTASVDGEADQVPLEVEYLVGGDQRTETVLLPLEESADEAESTGLSTLLFAGGLGLLGVVLTAIALIGRRQ